MGIFSRREAECVVKKEMMDEKFQQKEAVWAGK